MRTSGMAAPTATAPAPAAAQDSQQHDQHVAMLLVESEKQQKKAQKKLVDGLAASLQTLAVQEGPLNDRSRQRRKNLREIAKAVADTSQPLEMRLQLLHERFVAAVQEQQKQDKAAAAQASLLDASRREADTGRAELARVQQRVETLSGLCRQLTADNKMLSEQLRRKADAVTNVEGLIKDINTKIEQQQAERELVDRHHSALQEENALLKKQHEATQHVLDSLRQEQEARLNTLAQQVQHQAAEAQGVMHTALEENKALTLKAAAAEEMKVHVDILEKLVAEERATNQHYKAQLQEMQGALTTAAGLGEAMGKLQKQAQQQQQLTKQLLQERQLLQAKVQMLQVQARDGAEQLRRSQLQRQRLETLCRALQQQSGRGHAAACDGGPAAAVGGGDGAFGSSLNADSAAVTDGDWADQQDMGAADGDDERVHMAGAAGPSGRAG